MAGRPRGMGRRRVLPPPGAGSDRRPTARHRPLPIARPISTSWRPGGRGRPLPGAVGLGHRRPETDWQWADRRIGGLLDRGIRPVVELLHHGFGPSRGRPLSLGTTRHASPTSPGRWRIAIQASVEFLPINEPLTTARFAGLYGHWWPHARDDRSFIRLLVQQCLAFRTATAVIREMRPDRRGHRQRGLRRTHGTIETRAPSTSITSAGG